MDRERAAGRRRIVGEEKSAIQAKFQPMGARVVPVTGERPSRVEVDRDRVPVERGGMRADQLAISETRSLRACPFAIGVLRLGLADAKRNPARQPLSVCAARETSQGDP